MASTWSKMFSISGKTSPSISIGAKGGAGYQGCERIESWYRNVVYWMNRLEESVKPEAPSFSMDSLKIGVKLIQLMHSQVHSIVEDLWLPARTKAMAGAGAGAGAGTGTGDEVMNMYLEMNKTVLDIGTHVKEGLSGLEMYEMSLEHALICMASAVDSLPKCHADARRDPNSTKVPLKKLMEACSTEMARLESTKHLNIWEEFVSMMGDGPLGGSAIGGGGRVEVDCLTRQHKARIEIHKKKGALQRTLSMLLPADSVGRMALDITLLLLDAESITFFVSCILLWVLTDSSDKFKNAFNLVIPKLPPTLAYDKGDWLLSIIRLRDKILKAEATAQDLGMKNCEQHPRVNSVGELEHLRNNLQSLYAKIEEISLQRETTEGSTQSQENWMEDGSLSVLLEKSKKGLAEIMTCSDELGQEASKTHLDVLSSRKKILDGIDTQFVRSPTF